LILRFSNLAIGVKSDIQILTQDLAVTLGLMNAYVAVPFWVPIE